MVPPSLAQPSYLTHARSLLPVPLLHLLPINHLPDSLEVLGLAVLILQVVGVLPGVDAEQGLEGADDGVLVGVGSNGDIMGVLVADEPDPATALEGGEGLVEGVLEGGEGAVGAVQGAGEGAGWGLAAVGGGRRQVLPEQRVVDVAAAVEVEKGLQGEDGGDVLGFGRLLHLRAKGVVRVHVCLVVRLVVELHDLARDVRLQRAIVVCGRLLVMIALGTGAN
jgi:hypothetical protein